MLVNRRAVRIEWGDCDPAGIVYYPRYFAIFDASTTALIERALGMSKYDYLKAYDFAGHPVVETRVRFLLPTRFGDEVVIASTVVAHGRSSFKVEHRLTLAGTLAVEGSETRVWVGRDPGDPSKIKSQPLPPEFVRTLEALRLHRPTKRAIATSRNAPR